MWKKKIALKILINFYNLAKFQFKVLFENLLYKAVKNSKPLVAFQIMYIGGKKYKIPIILNEKQGIALTLKWLIQSARSTSNATKKLPLRMFEELSASSKNDSLTVKKRKEHHLIAYENKTYIRFLRFLK